MRDETISPAMLLARIGNLPDTSALSAALRGVPRGWGVDRHTLMTLLDALQQNTWATIAVAVKKRPPKPKPVQRPTKQRRRKVVSLDELDRLRKDVLRGSDFDGGTGRA